MTIKIIKIYFSIIFISLSLNSNAQPNFNIKVSFKLYENQKLINNKAFDKNYTLINNTQNYERLIKYKYNEKENIFSLSGDVIYNDLKIKIIKAKDTMQLIFKTNGGVRRTFNIKKLQFKEGAFVINDENTASLDLKNSKSNYYNYLLGLLPVDSTQIAKNLNFIEFNKLKLKYCIPNVDYNNKKENELVEISSLKDEKILERYLTFISTNHFGGIGSEYGNDQFGEGKVIYSPDKTFKIFVYKGESCGANCTTFYESFIHFNLDKKNPTVLHTSFFPIDSIIEVSKNKYLVFQTGYDGSGIYVYSHKIMTLISFENDKITIGGRSFEDERIKTIKDENRFQIDIAVRQIYQDDYLNDFYLIFDPKSQILKYKYWVFTNEEKGERRVRSGKLIFKTNNFRWISMTGY